MWFQKDGDVFREEEIYDDIQDKEYEQKKKSNFLGRPVDFYLKQGFSEKRAEEYSKKEYLLRK